MNYFFKHHCAISKTIFQNRAVANNNRNALLKMEECAPSYAHFEFLIDRVGTRWGWTDRPKYKFNQAELRRRLGNPETRLFTFKKGEKLIGYCLVTPSEEEIVRQYQKPVEIENFGFFPEYTGKGYGNFFLQAVFAELFNTYETVYLSTRSTNHTKVLPFYQKNGMILIKSERLPDDLAPVAVPSAA